MMPVAIVFDLDNTLIITHKRHYEVYKTIVMAARQKYVSFEEYLTLRIKHTENNAFVLKYLHGLHGKDIISQWLDHIEESEYLQYDHRIVDLELARRVRANYCFILLSLRSREINAMQQVKSLQLDNVLDRIEFVKHETKVNPKIARLQLLKSEYSIHSFVGDSIEDFHAAQACNIPFIGVDTGLLKLPEYLHLHPTVNHFLQTLE